MGGLNDMPPTAGFPIGKFTRPRKIAMHCPSCQQPVAPNVTQCGSCGASLSNQVEAFSPYQSPQFGAQQPARSIGDDPAMRLVLPVGQSIYAIVAGYLGLVSPLLCFLGPFAILFAILALSDIKKHPGRGGTVRAVVGIVGGLAGTIGMMLAIFVAVMG